MLTWAGELSLTLLDKLIQAFERESVPLIFSELCNGQTVKNQEGQPSYVRKNAYTLSHDTRVPQI